MTARAKKKEKKIEMLGDKYNVKTRENQRG